MEGDHSGDEGSNHLNTNWKGLFMSIWGSNSLNTDCKWTISAMRGQFL